MLIGTGGLCSMLVLSLASPPARAEGTRQSLFVIERSKNANIVQYDARLTADGLLDPDRPVEVYWLLRAEDGRREELSKIGRIGYGFSIKREPAGKSWAMTLAAYRKRKIVVRQAGAAVTAEILIDGRPAILEKLYISSTEGRRLPRVNYVELYGKDLQTGEKRYEKLIPGARDQP